MSAKSGQKWQIPSNCKENNVQRLLSSLQNHILAHHINSIDTDKPEFGSDDLLTTHISNLFTVACDILNRGAAIVKTYPSSLELLYNVLLESVAGGMLFKILNSLLLMPKSYLRRIHDLIQTLLEPLNKFTQLLPADLLMDSEKENSSKQNECVPFHIFNNNLIIEHI